MFYTSILLKIEFTPKNEVDSKCVYIVWAPSYTVKDNSKVHWSIDNILLFVWKRQTHVHTYMHMLGTFLKIHNKLEIVVIFGDNDWTGIQEKLYT